MIFRIIDARDHAWRAKLLFCQQRNNQIVFVVASYSSDNFCICGASCAKYFNIACITEMPANTFGFFFFAIVAHDGAIVFDNDNIVSCSNKLLCCETADAATTGDYNFHDLPRFKNSSSELIESFSTVK